MRDVDNGQGMTARARSSVTPIALRYVKAHQQHLFHLQTMRRDPGFVAASAMQIIDNTLVQSNCGSFNDSEWIKESDNIEVQ